MGRSRVVVVKASGSVSRTDFPGRDLVARMFGRGFALLTGERAPKDALMSVFRPGEKVAVKINTIGGKAISTRPDVSLALAGWLAGNGLRDEDLVIWDRTNRELRAAGYRLAESREGLKIFGTDTDGIGYEPELVSHLNVGSRFSKIQTRLADASISLAILKDHGMAGITAGMKNYFGAIHNPNKYHDDRCDPYVAEVFDAPPVRDRHRLSILDCLVVQYHRGPSYHPRWAEACGILIFSRDPVAADRTGWDLVERLRAARGLPTLEEEGRRPVCLFTAEQMGLGRAGTDGIEVIEEDVQ
jgi:uncharacterized protein (DUF362 family)